MISVADNLRITIPAIARAVENKDPAPVQKLVAQCRDAGAHAIDINSGPLSRYPKDKMRFLVETVRAVTDLPLVLDTSNPDAMAAGLAYSGGTVIINGISLEPEKLSRILPLALSHDCDVIGYLLDADGHVPADTESRMEAAVALFGECQAAGLSPDRLIVDPVVAPLSWPDGNHQNIAILDVVRTLPDLLGFPVRTIAGLSNLTTGAPDNSYRRIHQQAFLPMLAAAGASMILMNALDPGLMTMARACEKIRNQSIFSWE
ncbi:dihydropteroate synthase [Desulfosarcina sp. OttesenSCG-928-A07]|nr:dihydropteroate synthase [Desulfosarcina sp. OttesenSCG-928-A07]